MPTRSKNRSSKKFSRPAVLMALLIVVVITGSFLALRLKGDPKNNASTNTPASTEEASTPRPTTEKGQTNPLPSQEDPGTPAPANPNNQPVTKPSGSFVSNHKPGQNGSPTEEASVCVTTPGANCAITFTMNGTTKSLPAQTADDSGTVYWSSWTPASLGLTGGNWVVSAVATWGTQSASTQDPVPLQVSP